MFRPSTIVVQMCRLLVLAVVPYLPLPEVGPDALAGRQDCEIAPPPTTADDSTMVLSPGHVTIIIHGVNDDGKDWSLRFKKALTEGRAEPGRQEVYLFRWTQPDGEVPSVAHARNSLKAITDKDGKGRESDAAYQVAVAERLKEFLTAARALYREYGVGGKIDLVAHSQGTLIALEALDLGGEADDLVFMGSPLDYTGDRQEDVVGALPHVRGVLYNYYTRSDFPVRLMGGGLLREPCGWPQSGMQRGKVVQTCLSVQGHTGYYTPDAIRTNYLDKVGVRVGEEQRLSAGRAQEFTARWNEVVKAANLIDPE